MEVLVCKLQFREMIEKERETKSKDARIIKKLILDTGQQAKLELKALNQVIRKPQGAFL